MKKLSVKCIFKRAITGILACALMITVLSGCGVPFVQLPCFGVVDQFTTTGPRA